MLPTLVLLLELLLGVAIAGEWWYCYYKFKGELRCFDSSQCGLVAAGGNSQKNTWTEYLNPGRTTHEPRTSKKNDEPNDIQRAQEPPAACAKATAPLFFCRKRLIQKFRCWTINSEVRSSPRPCFDRVIQKSNRSLFSLFFHHLRLGLVVVGEEIVALRLELVGEEVVVVVR